MSTLVQRNADENKKIVYAIFFSLFIHFFLLLFAVAFVVSEGKLKSKFKPNENSAPVEMVFMEPQQENEPVYVNTNEDQKSEKAPENKTFESNNNTLAASEAPPQGSLPVPSQEGVDEKTLAFQDQNYQVGTPQNRPTPPQNTPNQQQEQQTQPQQQEQASATPPPPTTQTPANSVALLEPPVNKEARDMKPVRENTPESPPQSAYRPQTRATHIRGGISNRGRTAMDAVATPMGRYKKMLSDAIASRWYYYVDQQMGLLAIGTVNIHFIVRSDGTVHGARITSNSSNESFATCSLRSIMDAKIPPIPEDVAASLEKGSLEVDYSFSIIN